MEKEPKYSAFRSIFLLNLNDCRNFGQYRSVETMKSEQREHVKYFPLKIHPRSRFRTAWELFYLGYIVINSINSFSFHVVARYSSLYYSTDMFTAVSDLPLIINIVLNFMTGYYGKGSRTAIMNTSKVCKNYFFSFFFIDLFGLVSASPLIAMFYNTDFYMENNYVHHFLGLYFVVCLGVVARLVSPMYYWKRSLVKYFMLNNLVASVVEFFATFPIMVLLFTNLAFAGNYDYLVEQSDFERRKKSVGSETEDFIKRPFPPSVGTNESGLSPYQVSVDEDTSTALFSYINLIGKTWTGKEVMKDRDSCVHIAMDMVLIIYPYTRYFIVITFLIIVLWAKRGSRGKYNELMDNLDEYLQRVKISSRLKLRLSKYYEEIFGGRYYEESVILDSVSCEIREEIMAIKVSRLRQEIKLFSMIPLKELMAVARRLVIEVYFGNDVVVYSGAVLDRMYFLAKGTVAIYSNDVKELCHIPASNHFGWEGISDFRPVSINYLACETIISYTLSRNDYRTVVEQCPVFCELISFTNTFFSSFYSDVMSHFGHG